MNRFDIVVVNCLSQATRWAVGARAPSSPVVKIDKSAAALEGLLPLSASSHAANKGEPQTMGSIIRATGWLRASGFGSSTATFELDLSTTPASGRIQAEITMMVEAMAAGRATLVTESGRWIAIRPTGRTSQGLDFVIIDDAGAVKRLFN